MKRLLLHTLFWLAYLVQATFLIFLWDSHLAGKFASWPGILVAFETALGLLLPTMLFTYLTLYFILPRMLKPFPSKYFAVACFCLGLISLLFLTRAIQLYLVYPLVFHEKSKGSNYWSPFAFIFSFIDVGYVTAIAIIIKQAKVQLQSSQRERVLLKEKLEAEVKFLRNQTNPHFLFNTLNNIYGLALLKSEDTANVVLRLSNLLRFMIYETRHRFICIGNEIKMLENFIELEKIRYAKKLTVNFVKEVDCESESIIPLILIPFVENAFKHGAYEKQFDPYISVRLLLRDGQLHYSVENSKERGTAGSVIDGIGLSNVKRQLEVIYPEYQLDIINEESIFKVHLQLNLKKVCNYLTVSS